MNLQNLGNRLEYYYDFWYMIGLPLENTTPKYYKFAHLTYILHDRTTLRSAKESHMQFSSSLFLYLTHLTLTDLDLCDLEGHKERLYEFLIVDSFICHER